MWPFNHKHKWETTHTNQWQHPTLQKCKCGEVRRFEFCPKWKEMNGMPWNKGRWVDNKGKEYSYGVLD